QPPGGPGARGRGLANLGKGPSASRGQVAGGPDRPALPSRPGNASFPATAGGPGSPAAPTGSDAGRAPLTGGPGSPAEGGADRSGRPSWASRVEDSGRIPVVGDQGEGPRGHEEPDTGEYARPGFTGASGPAPRPAHPAGRSPQQFDAFGGTGATGEFRSPAAQGGDPGRPGGDRPGYPGDTAEFPAVGGQDFGTGRPAADRQGPTGYTETGEFPALGQDRGRGPAPAQNPGGYPADTGEFPAMGQNAGGGRGGYPADTGEFPALGQAPEPEPYPSETGEFPVLGQQQPSALPERHQPQQPAAFTDPLPAGGSLSSERTPIFEEMESTWFGTRRMEPPAPTGQQPATGTDTGAGPGLPLRGPRPGRTDSATAATGGDRAGDGYGAGPREEFPHTGTPAAAAPQGPTPVWRPSPNDELGRQAGQLRQPSAGGVTTSGLPRRVPRANLVAGAAQQSQQQAAPTGPQVSRAPDAVRGRLTNLRRGIQQGRQANSSAGRTDRGSGPRYQ
ncbi:histidine kinase, partial [Streptomyces sp. NPDC059853]